PRDLSVAAVENTVELKDCTTDDKTGVIATHEKKKCDDQQWKDQHCPSAGRNRRTNQSVRDQSRNRSIQKAGDESVLCLAAALKKPKLRARDVTVVVDISPRLALLWIDIRARVFEPSPKVFPNRRFVANRRVVFEWN